MTIRRACAADIGGINSLLRQVLEVHAAIRPDLFISGRKKYTDSQLEKILGDDNTPVFAAEEDGEILGYCFCILREHSGANCVADYKELYIDDLCVDENIRGRSIGKALYAYVLDYARVQGCYNVTLNVWEGNDGARAFYEKMGMRPQKTCMETVLRGRDGKI